MKTIPMIRTELLEIADETRSNSLSRRIKALVTQMYRRPPVRRAKVESVPFTPELARSIRGYARQNQDASYPVMARRFRVSIGRISEALAGKRAA